MNIPWIYLNKIHFLFKKSFRFLSAKSALILIVSLCLSIFACGRNNLWDNLNFDSNLPEVKLTSVTAIAGGPIDLTWEDPVSADVDHIEIESIAGTSSVDLLIQHYEITYSFVANTEYTITIRTADSFGKTSDGVSFSIIPQATEVAGHFIYTENELYVIGKNLTGYTDWLLGDFYYLMENLDLSGYTNWDPIGDDTIPFTGSFEGNNHTIRNLTNISGAGYLGLFAYVTGTVRNLVLNNVSISGSYPVGALTGYNTGKITNCTVTGTGAVVGNSNVGGLIGSNQGSVSSVSGLNSSITVTGGSGAGGVIGINGSSSSVLDCHSTGTVTGTGNIGGLIGSNSGNAALYNCSASGIVTGTGIYTGGLIGNNTGYLENCNTAGAVNGTSHVGGLVGNNTGNLYDCHATGNVNVNTTYVDYIGGLIGYNEGAVSNSNAYGNVTVTLTAMTGVSNIGGLVGITTEAITNNSYATGNVIVELTSVGTADCTLNLGGFIGHVNAYVTISDSYATGSVTASMIGSTSYNENLRVGGFVGTNNGGGITNCHYIPTTGVVRITCSDTYGVIAGGLIANNGTASAELTKCSATGAVTCTDTVSIMYIGGLVGNNSVPISSCFATGDVTGISNVGGLIGYNSLSTNIINCYSKGNIEGTNIVGGLIGYVGTSCSITYCYSTSVVTAASNWGGLIGSYTSGTLDYSYYNYANTDAGGNTLGLITPTYLADMIIESTYSDWDIDPPPAVTTWNIEASTNEGYPFLYSNPPQ